MAQLEDTTRQNRTINPAILYMGTPVVLISTENEDGSYNIAAISSAWWLGHRCMLGLAASSQTTINLLRTKQCALNLPSDDMASYVNAIACTTGTPEVPPGKMARGYRYVRDKFGLAGLRQDTSDLVRPPRAGQCPVQMEAELVAIHSLMAEVPAMSGRLLAFEVKILRVHAREDIISLEHENRIDPDKWRPLIMSFQRLYGLSDKFLPSKLAKIDEESYRIGAVTSNVK